jgi:replication-associated recombination protein RarA
MLLSSKYAPQNVSDFRNNPHLISMINGLITHDIMSLVLYGLPESGKTTLVNLIIMEYYGNIPTNDRIMYVNLLKDNGIAFCRNEMKMFCTRPYVASRKKNTIVFDDIGFISEQSQNIAKEYIDLYRDRVNFIITTSDINKVIPGIKSKVPLFGIKPPSVVDIKEILDDISLSERINISEENKSHLMGFVNGNIRVLYSYLEMLIILDKEITYELLDDICNDIPMNKLNKYETMCYAGDITGAIRLICNIKGNGYCNMDIVTELLKYIRYHSDMCDRNKYKVVELITHYMTRFCDKHECNLELCVFTKKFIDIIRTYPKE